MQGKKGTVTKKNRPQEQKTAEDRTASLFRADAFTPGVRWMVLGLFLVLLVSARVRLLDVPLERDEGEYAYMGQLLLQGAPPYSAAYNMKFPGIYLMYALIMAAFGQSAQGIHLGLLVVNCATVLILFALGKRLANDLVGLVASGAYAVLSLSSSVHGFAAHATHFVALMAVAGVLSLLGAVEKNRPRLYALSGMFFGLACLMKQPGVFFIAFGVSCILLRFSPSSASRRKGDALNLAIFLASALAPLMGVAAWLYSAAVFDTFWFWTVRYASTYGSQLSLSEAREIFQNSFLFVVDGYAPLWIISGLGFLVIIFRSELKARRAFLLLLAFFSCLTIFPGFYFRDHYFITLLPAIALSTGIFFNYLSARWTAVQGSPWIKFASIAAFAAAALTGVVSQREYLMMDAPAAVSRKMYGSNPFVESLEIARFIEARTSPSDRIAVFGSEPQLYFYAKRRSASGYLYMYEMMDIHPYSLDMQKEMIREVEAARPKFIVDVHVPSSWVVQMESEKYLLGWIPAYLGRGYSLVGIVDIRRPDATVYRWHEEINNYTIQSPSYVLIFERV